MKRTFFLALWELAFGTTISLWKKTDSRNMRLKLVLYHARASKASRNYPNRRALVSEFCWVLWVSL